MDRSGNPLRPHGPTPGGRGDSGPPPVAPSARGASTALRALRDRAHVVACGDRRLLLHIPSTALFELDHPAAAVLDALATAPPPGLPFAALRERVPSTIATAALAEAVAELITLDAVGTDATSPPEVAAPALDLEAEPLVTLVFNVNTGCNLSCTYCYKEDLTTPARGERLDPATARRGVDFLLRAAGERERIQLAFFGGEPLTNLPLIRSVVDYAEERAAQCGKVADFSLTTNATLMTDPVADYLDAHRFGITVSMDGPEDVHDRHRKTRDGRGSYALVARRAGALLARYRSRPIGARVTLTRGASDVVGIHRHLRDELGFAEVGFGPVSAASDAEFGLDTADMATVFAGFRDLGEDYVAAALENRNNGFANLHQILTDLHGGTAKALPCGAGVGLLALDSEGALHPCHRFTGSALAPLGDVTNGIDRVRQRELLGGAMEQRRRGPCGSCQIRRLCAGGCYHEAYTRYGDPREPTLHYCDLLRDWVDFGIGVYARIRLGNPDFLAAHVAPRRKK